MKSKKRLLKESRLYLIIDKKVCAGNSLVRIAIRAADAGADLIQLRDKESSKAEILKNAQALAKSLSPKKTLFIINDYLDVAKLLNCDGIHLGQDDASVNIARRILGKDKIIGISCSNSRQAKAAQRQGADYIGIGPAFPTLTKPATKTISLNLLKKTCQKIKIPVFALGGINHDNLKVILSTGVKRVALCRAICKSKDVGLATERLRSLLIIPPHRR